MKRKKITFLSIFVFICMFLITFGCAYNTSLESNNSKNKVKPEEQILINAEIQKNLQKDVMNEAYALLDLPTDTKLTDEIIKEKIENLTPEEEEIIISKINDLLKKFKSENPEAISNLFGNDEMPSGIIETDEELIIGGDIVINKADHNNAEKISTLIKGSYEEMMNNEPSRALSTTQMSLWPNGIVYYRIASSITYAEEIFIESCMREWQNASGGKIKFVQIPNGWWEQFTYTVGTNWHVEIKKGVVNKKWTGRATYGYGAWKYVELNPDFTRDFRTVAHELGHVLGLYHEHQRPDRDNYLRVLPSLLSNSNYTKINRIVYYVFFVTIYYQTPIYSSNYDYMSIMHYINLPHNIKFTDHNGNYIETGGLILSPTDKSFIKTLY